MFHVHPLLAVGDRHYRFTEISAQRLGCGYHERSLNNPVTAARRNGEVNQCRTKKGHYREGVFVRNIDEEFGNESTQTRMLHHQLDPSVEGELHQNTGSTACCRADSTHISHWRFM
ncbi:Uncharacterised protein [Shigella sonnei]|nr:Uncharacterised protein [Shigella sonnei]